MKINTQYLEWFVLCLSFLSFPSSGTDPSNFTLYLSIRTGSTLLSVHMPYPITLDASLYANYSGLCPFYYRSARTMPVWCHMNDDLLGIYNGSESSHLAVLWNFWQETVYMMNFYAPKIVVVFRKLYVYIYCACTVFMLSTLQDYYVYTLCFHIKPTP